METGNKNSTKNQIFVQIYLPLIVFILIIIGVAVLSILSTTNNFDLTAHWANISFVLLSVPALVTGFIVFVLLALLVFGQYKLIRWLPIQLKKLYALVLTVSAYIWKFTNQLSRPIIEVKSKNASLQRLVKFKDSRVGGNNGK